MNKKTYFIIPVSFITAAFLAAVIFVVSGIYPGSERTLLIFDMKEQFVSFYAYLSRVDSFSDLKYTFEGSLGTPLAGLISYYLASPLNLIYLLYDVRNLPDAILIVDILKTGFIAVSFACFALYKGVKEPLKVLILSLCYALSSAAVTFFILPMYLDTLFWLPLIAVSLDKMLMSEVFKKSIKPGLIYSALLFLCILTHYYSAYMVCLFLAMYAVYVLADFKIPFKKAFYRYIRFICYSLVSSCFALLILMPVLRELLSGKVFDSGVYSDGRFFVISLSALLKQFICGSFGGLYSEGGPSIYCTLIMLALAVYTLGKKKTGAGKYVSFGVLTLLFLSFYIRPLYRIWHMFRDPVAYPHRFAFIFVFFVMVLATEGICGIKAKTSLQGAVLGLISCLLIFNGYRQIDMELKTLPCATLSDYRFFIDTTSDLVEYAHEDSENLCRISKDYEFTSSDTMLLGFNGLDYFSSSYDPDMLRLYKDLGLLQYHYKACDEGTTILTDMLLGVDYMIHKGHADYGYEYLTSNGFSSLSRNPYSLGLGYLVDGSAVSFDAEKAFGPDAFENQNLFLNAVLGDGETYLEKLEYTEYVKDDPTAGLNPGVGGSAAEESVIREIRFTAPAGKNIYLNFALLNESELDYESKAEAHTIVVTMDDSIIAVFSGYQKSYNIRLGRFDEDRDLTVVVVGTKEYREPFVYALDGDSIDRIYDSLSDSMFEITRISGDHIEGRISAEKEGKCLLLTIPYSDDIEVFIDGNRADTCRFAGALLMVPGIETGEHSIEIKW